MPRGQSIPWRLFHCHGRNTRLIAVCVVSSLFVLFPHQPPQAEEGPSGIVPSALPADADDDGMPDSWETSKGLNPNNPADAWLDPDGDRVVNLFEYQLNSNPTNPATPSTATVGPVGADFTDVASALAAVAAGTCIRVAEGTYPVSYGTSSPAVVMIQGGWSANFTERNVAVHPTVFDAQQKGAVLYFSASTGQPVVILDGLRLVGGLDLYGAVALLAHGDAFLRTSLLDCVIADSSTTETVYGGALTMNNSGSSSSDRTIANTMIVNNDASGIKAQISDDSTARWRVIDSTISHNRNAHGGDGYGIRALAPPNGQLNVRLSNTILWGNEQLGLRCDNAVTVSADFSDVGGVVALDGAVYTPGLGVIDADPLFAVPDYGDFHLTFASPCVDAGSSPNGLTWDFEGEPRGRKISAELRGDGSNYDIGADEIFNPAPDPPVLGDVVPQADANVALSWLDPHTTQTQFLGFAWDLYKPGWVETGWNGTLWHPFAAATRSGQMDLGLSGAYHVWISSRYPEGYWLPCTNPWTGIVYSGAPHGPMDAWVEDLGSFKVRLHWKPEIYGTWHYQITAYKEGEGFVETNGPCGLSQWHFIDYGQTMFIPGTADFLQGWADFTLSEGLYWFFIRGVGWLDPYPGGDFAQPSVQLAQEITIALPDSVPLNMIRISNGNFQMGSPDVERSRNSDEGPVHLVTFAHDFYMGKQLVTQRQWRAVTGNSPAHDFGVGDDYPVYNVSWDDCQGFIAALNLLEQGTFRLPSEAEWEYACRAGTQTRFFFGDSLTAANGAPIDDRDDDGPAGTLAGNRSDYMWYLFNSTNPANGTKPVGAKLPNQFHLFDVSGNLAEWCEDWYHTDYSQPGRPDDGSAWTTQQAGVPYRVFRGGDWLDDAKFCRSANRGHDKAPGGRYPYIGLRIVRVVE